MLRDICCSCVYSSSACGLVSGVWESGEQFMHWLNDCLLYKNCAAEYRVLKHTDTRRLLHADAMAPIYAHHDLSGMGTALM